MVKSLASRLILISMCWPCCPNSTVIRKLFPRKGKSSLFFRGADLAALVHEASIVALKRRLIEKADVTAVGLEHFLEAVKRIRQDLFSNE